VRATFAAAAEAKLTEMRMLSITSGRTESNTERRLEKGMQIHRSSTDRA
jgi:hypothetical protein